MNIMRFNRLNYSHYNTFISTFRRLSSSSAESIDKLVKNNKVVVFMKGVPDEPRCGFSNAVVQIFRMHGVTYDAHDVLKDEDLRQGIKSYSNWPTIPQVFIGGEFVGGCDIMLQMHQNGELIEELRKAGIKSALLDKALQDQQSTKSEDKK
ncbi:Glutaredoxin-related protein 5 [Blattella germanica]|nr:Glutaredoxin-related protein 5 [Blattella germanica]